MNAQTHKRTSLGSKRAKRIKKLLTFSLSLVCLMVILFSCSQDDTLNQGTETSTEVQDIIPRKMPFDKAPHYAQVKKLLNQMTKNLNDNTVKKRGGEGTETFDILTDEVVYMEYDDTHTYTFKVRRSNPEYYIENVVLHYNPETDEYDEYLMQYPVNEQEFLEIANGNFAAGELPVIAQKFENGTFTGLLSRMSCVTTCTTVAVNCTANGNHAPGEDCSGTPDQLPYTYVSCSTRCFMDFSIGDGGTGGGGDGGGGNGGGGGGGNTNTVPFPMEPCNTGGGGSGGTGPGTGIEDGDGMCVVPWVAAMNAQLNLTQTELRVLEDYPELLDLFGQYFAQMGNDADYGLIRSLINYMIVKNDYEGVAFVSDLINLLIDLGYTTPNFTASDYPGLTDGFPFDWWSDYNFLNNNFSLDTFDPYKRLTEEEKRLVKIFPTLAYFMSKNKDTAENETILRFGKNGLNDKSDAFRHAYFNALNTRSAKVAVVGNGAAVVRMFGEAHESEVPAQLQLEKEMDLHNNEVGIQYCTVCSPLGTTNQSISDGIMQLVVNGTLKYLDPLNFIFSPPFDANNDGIQDCPTCLNGIIPTTIIKNTNQ
ncbi:hypothetical protein EI546_12710 [Aequorivita sp. H23M31]|uniref:DUF6973 domain-containing protein n=1 Tax=Aequorivita ciconiae TaxID=2494375 RepID=A0A410G5H4_9FLAO|nr:hypothetical protein [Aequorivita sp. H23M31]QAA82526.1 hypothetical protein EI546_12710 [Aequorivita sp. H23M31]